jgi:hypothetical protein
MLNRVASHVDSADVVTEDDYRGREGTLKLEKKLSKPTTLSDDMSHSTILGLSTGARHSSLALGGPGHQIVPKIDTIARGGSASVGTTCPIRIGVRGEGCGRCGVKLKSEVQGATNVAQNPLDEVEMRFPRSMHVETGLLNIVSDVGTRQCQVLKSSCKAPVLGGVGNKRTIIGRQFATGANGRDTRVAIHHSSTLKKVDGVLSL